MAESLSFTAVYEPAEDGWTHAHLAELPGVMTAAPTRAEAETMLLDAFREYLLSFTEEPAVVGGTGSTSSVAVTFSTSAA